MKIKEQKDINIVFGIQFQSKEIIMEILKIIKINEENIKEKNTMKFEEISLDYL